MMDLGIVNIDLFEAHVHYKRSMKETLSLVIILGNDLRPFLPLKFL